MVGEKLDRRIRKTRALLIQGLIKLLKEKDIKDISVKELADLCDINRGTFYLHYSDIYDMVEKIEDDLFEEFSRIISKDLPDGFQLTSYYEVLLDLFNALNDNREITQVLIGPHGDLTFVNRLKQMVKDRLVVIMADSPRGQGFEYHYAFVVSGFIGVFETWLMAENPLSPEQMAQLCSHMLTPELLETCQ